MKYIIENGVVIITLIGEIDISNADSFKAECREILAAENKDIVFDCAALTFIDSTALGSFVAVRKTAVELGVKIRLIHMNKRVYKLFKITDLDKTFDLEELK